MTPLQNSQDLPLDGPQDTPVDHAAWPIAIVGIGCRLPGNINNPLELWELLANGGSGKTAIPQTRFNAQNFYHPEAEHPGTVHSTEGYYLSHDTRSFDNEFFGINNLEATHLDPQQRQLLEVVYECCENAGLSLADLSGSNTGCFVGNFTNDAQHIHFRSPESFHRYSATGLGTTILANRINYIFDLRGPSVVLDTACSSSLYALHLACSALRAGECDAAIVAGANLIQSPEAHIATTKAGVLSPTGTCHTFDSAADGYGRAEGVCAIYIKRVSDASRHGDSIRSVITGTAVNSNGKTQGITMPSVPGQESVIRQAYANAGASLGETDYVECHGTGTAVGDPIEVEALSRAIPRDDGTKMLIGSVKTNLGHSEAASGLTSIIKVTLALEKGRIPPTIGLKNLNPKIRPAWNMDVVTSLVPWPTSNTRRASINSFGYGGANAHCILEAASDHVSPKPRLPGSTVLRASERLQIVPICAASTQSLREQMAKLVRAPDTNRRFWNTLRGLCRKASFHATRDYIIIKESDFSSNLASKYPTPGAIANANPLPLAYVFTGQGAQWQGMGRQLLQFARFRSTIQILDECLKSLPDSPPWTLIDVIQGDSNENCLDSVSCCQAVCTAIQVAIVDLLSSWRLRPEVVVGHSSGEIAAAYTAEHITAEDAVIIAYLRGIVAEKAHGQGAMLAVGMTESHARAQLERMNLTESATVACISSPSSVTLSGDEVAINEIAASLKSEGVFNRLLKTGGRAYHSKHMVTVGQLYETSMESSVGSSKKCSSRAILYEPVEMISSVTGSPIAASQTCLPAYWRQNMESPVQFSRAVEHLASKKNYFYVEIGPHSALELPLKSILTASGLGSQDIFYSSALRRNDPGDMTLLRTMGALYVHGLNVAFEKINEVDTNESIDMDDLPTYAWEHGEPLWKEPRESIEYRTRSMSWHELLGAPVPGGSGTMYIWKNQLHPTLPWLMDHRFGGSTLLPGAGYIAMATEALQQIESLVSCNVVALRQVKFLKALRLVEGSDPVELFTVFRRKNLSTSIESDIWWEFEISSISNQAATIHAKGNVGVHQGFSNRKAGNFHGPMEQRIPASWYKRFNEVGYTVGDIFKSLTQIHTPRRPNALEASGSTDRVIPPRFKGEDYLVHPVTIDAAFQTAWIATTAGHLPNLRCKIPVSIDALEIDVTRCKGVGNWSTRGWAKQAGVEAYLLESELRNSEDDIALKVSGLRIVGFDVSEQKDAPEMRHPMLRILWKPDIAMLSPTQGEMIASYLKAFNGDTHHGRAFQAFCSAIDLVAHKASNLKVLNVHGGEDGFASLIKNVLGDGSELRRFESYEETSLDAFASEPRTDLSPPTYYGLTMHFPVKIGPLPQKLVERLAERLSPGGVAILCTPPSYELPSLDNSITILEASVCDRKILMLRRMSEDNGSKRQIHNLLMVTTDRPSKFENDLCDRLQQDKQVALKQLSLGELTASAVSEGCTVICTIEWQRNLLSTVSEDDLLKVRLLTDRASYIMWITEGSPRSRPENLLMTGLSRALILEQPALKFVTYSVVDDSMRSALDNIAHVLTSSRTSLSEETEFLQRDGMVHVSRFQADNYLNQQFRNRQYPLSSPSTLAEAGPVRLAIESPGKFESIYFNKVDSPGSPIADDYVEIEIKCIGLNEKDVYVLSDKIDVEGSPSCSEFSGIIKNTGANVQGLSPGDKVLAVSSTYCDSIARVPASSCIALAEQESFTETCTLPIAFCTAFYALDSRASLRENETVLIHSASSAFGQAAIQVAQLRGAVVFATVGSEEQKAFLTRSYGLDPRNVFTSVDFVVGVLRATNSKGVDVILNTATGSMLHESWRLCAPYGRFVELGRFDVEDHGKLDMEVFKKGTTFTAFDIGDFFDPMQPHRMAQGRQLLTGVLDMYRSNQVRAISPAHIFDVSRIADAFHSLSSRTLIGKVIVSLEDPKSTILARSPRHTTRFDVSKSYLMVGCLGGLGRSLSKWMQGRGAAKFVFIGRSGTSRPQALQLVEDLQGQGARVEVVRGDASCVADVETAITTACELGPLGGIVHAAMGLSESLFTSMSHTDWMTSINPKVHGTWNLHNALSKNDLDRDLDFFLLTSSISGSVGTATEGNYCAANAFQDSFAAYRRGLGLTATALGLGMISEVGYLAEHPEIEQLLLRRGLQPIPEEELLDIVDIALSSEMRRGATGASEWTNEAHILTGMEASGFRAQRLQGFEGTSHVMTDPRFALLARALMGSSASSAHSHSTTDAHLPPEIITALQANTPLLDAVLALISQKMSHLILLPVEKVDPAKRLAAFGMDSMLAAEFRTWAFQAMRVDVSFLMLLSRDATVMDVARHVAEGIEAKRGADAMVNGVRGEEA